MQKRPIVFIAGSGGIGRALALLLRNEPSMAAEVILGDLTLDAAHSACEFANAEVATDAPAARGLAMPIEGTSVELDRILTSADAILDCLPGSQAPRMAALALEHGCHYLNLTEYVAETKQVLEMSKGASTCFGLQCGLAPGYINILGHELFQRATKNWGVDKVDRLEMRVGALTRHAAEPHFYGWTWSPVGVATEYVKDAIAVRGYKTVSLPSLTERKTVLLHGLAYEEALTSGGAADLPEALAGKVRDLDYKTLRYPGHYQWVEDQLASIPAGADRADRLQSVMESAIPHCEDDLVIVYASVEGNDASGVLRNDREVIFCPSIEVAGRRLRAIQSTTAAGIAEVLRLALVEGLSGPLLQSGVPTRAFLEGPFVRLAYLDEEGR